MSDNTSLLTVSLLLEELKEVTDWYMLGAYLNVPVHELKKINPQDGVERCKLEVLQFWLNTTITASWKDIARALEQLDMLTLAARLKLKYLWTPPVIKSKGVSTSSSSSSTTTAITASELARFPPPPSSASQPTKLSSDAAAEIETDRKIVEELRDLVSGYSLMLTKFKRLLAGCDISDARFFLNHLLSTDVFTNCNNIEQLLNQLCHGYVDTFNVYYLQQLATCLERNDVNKLVKQYEKKKDKFLKETTVLSFHKAIISKVPVLPEGMAKITIRIPKEFATNKVLKDMEELAIKAFGDSYQKWFVQFHVIAGSVVICWFVVESLCEVLQQLAQEKVAVWRQHGVEEVMVGSQCVYCSSSMKEEAVEQFHHYSQGIKRERSGADYSDYETVAKTIKPEITSSTSEDLVVCISEDEEEMAEKVEEEEKSTRRKKPTLKTKERGQKAEEMYRPSSSQTQSTRATKYVPHSSTTNPRLSTQRKLNEEVALDVDIVRFGTLETTAIGDAQVELSCMNITVDYLGKCSTLKIFFENIQEWKMTLQKSTCVVVLLLSSYSGRGYQNRLKSRLRLEENFYDPSSCRKDERYIILYLNRSPDQLSLLRLHSILNNVSDNFKYEYLEPVAMQELLDSLTPVCSPKPPSTSARKTPKRSSTLSYPVVDSDDVMSISDPHAVSSWLDYHT